MAAVLSSKSAPTILTPIQIDKVRSVVSVLHKYTNRTVVKMLNVMHGSIRLYAIYVYNLIYLVSLLITK